MIKKSTLKPLVILAICLVGIFCPDLTPLSSSSRSLSTTDERVLQLKTQAATTEQKTYEAVTTTRATLAPAESKETQQSSEPATKAPTGESYTKALTEETATKQPTEETATKQLTAGATTKQPYEESTATKVPTKETVSKVLYGESATKTPIETRAPAPVELATKEPNFETKPPVLAPVETRAPVPVAELTKPPFDGGVNGDPLIMGLSGQLFKFDGRSGAWYSAVSTPSFQWNLKVNNYETCPDHSNTFVSGAGFTFFDKKGRTTKRIELIVANPYNVDVGCGSSEDASCLGAGSVELLIDGVKHVVGGDYYTKDGTTRITAFNTFFQCSRKWYDFDVRPRDEPSKGTSLRSGRALAATGANPDVFDVISSLKPTMIDEIECQRWIQDRQAYSDLFKQPGHYSTIIIKTADITLHLEYKQENERCNAHSVDVWISSVSPALLEENWEGIIGETKDINYVPTGEDHLMVDRSDALKYPHDDDYEVNSPFSTKCKGCNHQ